MMGLLERALEALKEFFKNAYAVAATVFLIILAIILLFFREKFQIGGILGNIWGKKPESDPRVTVVPGRVNKNGEVIRPGESDDEGFVQAPVKMDIEPPGIFSDPTTIVIKHPEKGNIVLNLPEGVKNEEVNEVVEIKPDVYEVRNNDTGVNPDDVLSILNGN